MPGDTSLSLPSKWNYNTASSSPEKRGICILQLTRNRHNWKPWRPAALQPCCKWAARDGKGRSSHYLMCILKQTKLNPLSLESTHAILNTFGRKEKYDKSSRQASSKFGNEPIPLPHPSPIKWCYLLPPNYFYSLSVSAVLPACLRSGKDFLSQWKSFLQHAWIALPLACYSWREIYCRCNNTANKSAIWWLYILPRPLGWQGVTHLTDGLFQQSFPQRMVSIYLHCQSSITAAHDLWKAKFSPIKPWIWVQIPKSGGPVEIALLGCPASTSSSKIQKKNPWISNIRIMQIKDNFYWFIWTIIYYFHDIFWEWKRTNLRFFRSLKHKTWEKSGEGGKQSKKQELHQPTKWGLIRRWQEGWTQAQIHSEISGNSSSLNASHPTHQVCYLHLLVQKGKNEESFSITYRVYI